MVTLGMMCHVLTVTTTLVLKVLSVARFITIFIFMFQIVNLSRHVTTFKKVITQLRYIILSGKQVRQIAWKTREGITPIRLTQVKVVLVLET